MSIAEFSVTMATMPVSPKAAIKEVQDLSFLAGKAFVSMFRRPFYVRDILMQMDLIGVGSLMVVMLTGFFTGAVLTLQSSKELSRFGGTSLTGGLVSVSLVRELGPVLAALMVAGRVGSGMASELGSMLVTEQINAMRALGTDPIKKLVVPRILATIAMMPVLTIVADSLGIIGGLAVALSVLHITPILYLSRAWDSLNYVDVFGGLIKPLVFGALLASVSCHCGLRTYGGTQGVGRSTTQAVVASSVLILIFDFFLTRLILAYT
ncbi:MAG TPA: ABC transporter permease [Terriglobia bacterium]